MIIFSENGRLGNQLFQYYGLKKYFPRQRLIFFGFESLRSVASDPDAIFVDKSKLISPFFFLCFSRFLLLLSRLRLLGSISEDRSSRSFKLLRRKGLIFNLYLSSSLYFQHRDCIDDLVQAPSLRPGLLAEAHSWLSSKGLNHNSDYLVFVHIRRGDYLRWPSAESPAVISCSWYFNAIEVMQARFHNSAFVLMSDDVMYLEDVFGSSPRFYISRNMPEVDLALMSVCHSGILSASSFAWWGAHYSRSRNASDSIYIAPLYWCGHRAQSWYPENFHTKWITYLK